MVSIKDKKFKRILVIPDLHFPWANWDAIYMMHRWYKKHKPDLVVQLGDIIDAKAWSRWPKEQDDFSPSEEYLRARKDLERFHKLFPKMIVLSGNHDRRMMLKAAEVGLPKEALKSMAEMLGFKGWEWRNPESKLILDTPRGKILFMHGDESGGTVAQKSRIVGMSVVQGHTHKASITYTQSPHGHFFGFEAGALMDPNSKAAKYSASNPIGASMGFGVIKFGVPYFISYSSDVKGV